MIYSPSQLKELEIELEKYKIDIDVGLPNGDKKGELYFGLKGLQKYLIDKGILADREEWCVLENKIFDFNEMREKLYQLTKMIGKREYAIKMEKKIIEDEVKEPTENFAKLLDDSIWDNPTGKETKLDEF